MHVIIQPLVFDHLAVSEWQPLVTMLYGDDNKPLRVVHLDVLESYIYMEHQYYRYKVENNITYLWVLGATGY